MSHHEVSTLFQLPGQLNKKCQCQYGDVSFDAELHSDVVILLLYPGNIVALLHAFFSNLPQEWLEGTHDIIKHLRPVTSVAMLRIAFRIMGPLLPRLANAHNLFNKV